MVCVLTQAALESEKGTFNRLDRNNQRSFLGFVVDNSREKEDGKPRRHSACDSCKQGYHLCMLCSELI